MGMQQAANNLDPQTLAKILALRKGEADGNNVPAGNRFWTSEFGYDEAAGTHPYSVNYTQGWRRDGGGGESSSEVLDNSLNGEQYITRVRAGTGGKLGDRWDLQGNYLGTYEAQDGGGRSFNQAVLMAAPAVAGIAGAAAGSSATATGGIDAASLATSDIGIGGVTTGGSGVGTGTVAGTGGIQGAANGAFLGEGAASGIGSWDAAAIKSATMSGELGTAASYAGQNLANGTLTDTARSLTGTLSDANSVKNAADAAKGGNGGSKDMNWLDVVNTGAGIYGMVAASNNSSNATDAAKSVADSQLALNKESLDWYKQVYSDQAPDRAAAAKRAQDISDAQLAGMNLANDNAKKYAERYDSTFVPIENRLASEALAYDTAGRRESAAQEAAGQVATEFDLNRSAAGRNMQMAGVDPSTIAALDASSRIDEAKARAGAGNTARTNVEQQGWSRMADVANLGRGIATNSATQQGIATTTGNSSATNAVTGLNAATSGNDLMAGGFRSATQGNQVVGSLFNNVAANQRADDQMLISGIGGIANFAGNRYGTSDPKVKKGTGKMANAAKALKEVEATPVHEGWEYDEKKGAPAGSGGKKMIGPMATDVQRISGEASAPGGKQIDLVKQQGRMMAAIQKLAKDVRALKKHETEPETEEA